jgi:hypothetical protein
MTHVILSLSGYVLFGITIGRHFGALEGITAALALYVMTPYDTRVSIQIPGRRK